MNILLTIEDICKKLRPVFGKRIEQIYLKYRLSNSMDEKKEIEQALNALYHKHLNEGFLNEKILLEPPTEAVMHGEYPLGMISYADKEIFPFALREKDWVRHVCISGMSGSGKTNLAFQIIDNFIKHKKPFMVFDWKKSFRPLTLVNKEILMFTVGNNQVSNLFKININKPPKGVPAKEWLNFLSDLITESFFASYGVHKLISETIDKAFEEFGIYEGSDNYPTWHQIKDRLEERADKLKRKGRESEWITSALRIAHVLTFGPFGEAVNFKDKAALSVEDLLDKKVIFELNSLNNVEKKFFCEFILMYIYKLRKANETVDTGSFKHAIIVDEAHNIFLKDRPHFVNETTTDMIYRELREYGTSLICLDQHVSKLSDTVAGNSACNIAFQQMLYKDVETVSGIMQLGDVKQYFSMLPVGSAIVKLAERYYRPFLVSIPFVELKQEAVSDQDIKDMMQKKVKTKEEYERFRENSSIINIAEDMAKVSQIFKISGVDTTKLDEEVEQIVQQPEEILDEKQETISKIAQKAVDKDNAEKEKIERESKKRIIPRHFITNHLQAYIVDYLRAQMKKGYSLEILKQHLLNQGYKPFDILKAINHIRNVPEDLQSRTGFEFKEFKEADKTIGKTSVQIQKSYSLTQKQKQVLELISKYPTLGTAKVYQYLGLSARKGNELRKELIDMGLLRIEEQRSDKGWKKILTPTETTRAALESPVLAAE